MQIPSSRDHWKKSQFDPSARTLARRDPRFKTGRAFYIRAHSDYNERFFASRDSIFVYKVDALQDLQPRLTKNYCDYCVLTNQVVPPDRILGIWSLINNAWIQKPTPAEVAKMDDLQSDIGLAMHIAHRQQYWLKRQENDRNRITWSRKQYLDHVLVYLTNADNVSKVFTAWRSQADPHPNGCR